MNPSTLLTWEDRLTRLSFALLFGATVYGIVVGAIVTMYYDLTPNMGALEDNLGMPQLILYLLAVLISFIHLPFALLDIQQALWQQAAIRIISGLGPLIIFLGTDGLIAHFLWWSPLSDTDRFHILHHTVFASLPLTFGYGLALRWLWRPATFTPPARGSVSLRVWFISGIGVAWFVMGVGLLMGLVSPVILGVSVMGGLVALPIIWRMAG